MIVVDPFAEYPSAAGGHAAALPLPAARLAEVREQPTVAELPPTVLHDGMGSVALPVMERERRQIDGRRPLRDLLQQLVMMERAALEELQRNT